MVNQFRRVSLFIVGLAVRPCRIYLELIVCGLLLLITAAPTRPQQPAVQSLDDSLQRHGVNLSRQSLIAALASPDQEVRVLAANKLAQNGDKQAIPFIEKALSNEKEGTNRLNMALYLAQLGDEKGISVLKNTCSGPKVPDDLKIRAATNLAIVGKDDCLPVVLSVLRASNNPDMTRMALILLTQIFNWAKPAPREVLDLICNRLTDPARAVRLTATDVLSRLGNGSQSRALESALAKETDEDVRSFMQRNLSTLSKNPPKYLLATSPVPGNLSGQ